MTKEERKIISIDHDNRLKMAKWCLDRAKESANNKDHSGFRYWMEKSEEYTQEAIDISYKMFNEILSDMKGDE